MHIYTVTQSGFQLWQIYPMICTKKSFIYFVDHDLQTLHMGIKIVLVV